jgi:hypothetical protein
MALFRTNAPMLGCNSKGIVLGKRLRIAAKFAPQILPRGQPRRSYSYQNPCIVYRRIFYNSNSRCCEQGFEKFVLV